MAKRALDVFLSAFGLLASAPLWALLAAAIKMEDGGPVFYAQERVGRLMRATAMDELPQLWNIMRGDMSFVGPRALRPGEIEAEGDGRLVRLEDVPGFEQRIIVRPGLTGIAQVYARRDIPRRQKFRYDRLYVHRRSWMLDVRLILLSFWISVHGTWEARGRKY
jgi:lipopolysaccharide/colanic/teichoic acid biosynthesis glycosyltransferase